MDENFDWLNSNTETIKEIADEILDLEYLDIIKDFEKDGQDRESIYELLLRRSKKARLELFGFDLNVLDMLLNHVPIYVEGKKEPYSTEMRDYIYERDNYECRLCYSSWNGFHCHHIIPNGSASEDNLITLCLKCHEIVHRLLRNKGYVYNVYSRRY